MTDQSDIDFSELDCKIFVDGPSSTSDLVAMLSDALGGASDDNSVQGDGVELLVSESDDVDAGRKADLDEGFLFFRFIAEVYFAANVEHGKRVTTVAQVLTALWDRGWPAVGACDYEDDLPKRGGVDGTAPWPGG
jgi:hypothetical protein